MTIYNLDKGVDNDTNGQVLRNWIIHNYGNIHNLTIRDKGIATIENMYNLMVKPFGAQTNLISVDFSNFNTSNVTTTFGMFNGCYNLTNVSNFNTSSVTNMRGMFSDCPNLTAIPNFDTSNVTSMTYMFIQCNNLVNIPQYNTSNVNRIDGMVSQCNNLSNASIQNIINMCLNSNVPASDKILYTNSPYSPFAMTKYDNSYYQDRWPELTNAGWTY